MTGHYPMPFLAALRFGVTANNGRFWPAMTCRLMTENGHPGDNGKETTYFPLFPNANDRRKLFWDTPNRLFKFAQ